MRGTDSGTDSGTDAAGHSRPRWYVAGRAFALVMRAIPRRARFDAAVLVARLLTPLLQWSVPVREQRRSRIETTREIILFRALDILTRYGTEFDPPMRLEGAAALDAALGAGRGVLILSGHTMLNTLLMRYMHEHRHPMTTLTAAAWMRVPGLRTLAPTMRRSPTFLLSVRRRLRQGEIVGAMVEAAPTERRGIEFATAEGPMVLTDALVRVATRCGARVLFVGSRLDDHGRVVLSLSAPAPAAGATSEGVLRALIAFLQGEVAERRQASGVRRQERPREPLTAVDASPGTS